MRLTISTGEFVHQQSVYMGFVWNVFGYILFPFCLVFSQDGTCWNRRKLQVCGLNSGALGGCHWNVWFHSRIWMPRTKSSERRWTASIAWCRTGLNSVAQTYSWDCGCFAPFVTPEIWIFMDVGFWDPLFVNLHACAFADKSISVHSSRWFCYLCHKCLDPTCLWWISTTSPHHLGLPRIWSKPKRSPFSTYPPPDSTVIQQPDV